MSEHPVNLVGYNKTSDEPPSYEESKGYYEEINDARINPEVNGAAVVGGQKETPLSIAEDTDKKEKDKKKKEDVPMVGVVELFRHADCRDKLLLIIGIIVALCNGAALPAMMIVFGEMIDDFINTGTPANGTAPGISPVVNLSENMTMFAIYYIAIGCGVLVLSYIQVTFFMMSSIRQAHRIRVQLFRSVMRQDISWFDTHEVGEINNRLADDVNKIQEGIGEKIGTFFQWTSAFLCGFIVGFYYGWELTLVILAVSPLLIVSAALMAIMISKFTSNELGGYAQAGSVAEEVIGAIRTVTAFNGQEKESLRYASKLVTAKKFGIKKSLVGGLGIGFVYLVMFGTYSLAFWYGTWKVRVGVYQPGEMIIIFFCVIIGAFALGNAAPPLQTFSTARGAAHILYRIIDRKSEIDPTSEEGMKPDSVEGNIEFQNVVFRYPSRPDVPVLNDVNLVVNVGQTAALVGSSGCGKSTTVQLIQRFYDPLEGTVLVDGIDVKQLNVKWLRQQIGVVSQEPVLFHTTIGENIRYGRDDVTDEELVRATVMANAHDFISKLPKGLETLVGDRGAQLSGGQKQRIAIARALVRDPRILLLDEATSALDTESEAVVQAALDKAREGRTTIIVAHRLSTVKSANTLYGFKEGTVAESGSHDELMKDTSGIYYKLVTNQSMAVEEEVEMEEMENNEDEETKSSLERNLSSRRRSSGRLLHRGVSTSSKKDNEAESKEEPKLPFRSLLRAYGMNRPETGYIVVGCIASIINGAYMPAFAIVFAEILGVFAIKDDDDEYYRQALIFSLMFLVIGIVAGLAMFFQSLMFGISGESLTMRMRVKAMRCLLRQDIAYFDDSKNSVGALTTRLSTDASAVHGVTGIRIGMVLQVVSGLGTALVIGFYYSWQLTLLILAFLPIFVIAGALEMMVAKGFAGRTQDSLENAGKVACEAIENIRTVASLTRETKFITEYETLLSKPHRQSLIKSQVYGIGFALSQATIYFAYAAIFYVGAILIEQGKLEFVAMFKVYGAIVFSAMGIGQAAFFAPDYGKAAGAAVRVFELLDRVPAIDSYSEEGHKQDTPISGEIEFKEVRFNYPSRSSVPVLRGLDLQAMKGQIVALVGSSGCGKSTTVQLLERFYDPLQGAVHIDGRDLKDYNVKWIRSQMSIVSQEPVLFATSIKENIAYGDNSRDVNMEAIIAAARKANIHNFIESLPQGYETSVGEKGAQLSGGQKQRVAIARALIANPKILLLDEATSALDTESEKVVQAALDLAQVGRTSIVIAHRLSTIQNADLILVIHNGKVAESGKHSELLAKKGVYYKLNVTQAV